ncbi:MAG: D-alanyl-D-alanine carboxypeptidase [Betaproteobacteria bacterium]|nr:D-alanyl-D-alanine carboxypeptidase [Betaproteobacteria bacterium]
MLRLPLKTLFALLLALVALDARAQMPSPPDVAAKAWVLYDMTSHQVLASKDMDAPVEPASLTKLMTAYLVFDALKTKRINGDEMITPSVLAWKQEGSRMFIEPRKPVSVNDLLKGMIAQSGNDATVALAETVSGSVDRFVELMNRQAQLMGLKNTTYKNPTGLPAPGHVTTARDLVTLSSRLIGDFPEYFPLYSLKEFTYNSISQPNRNLLLFRDPTVDGLKTGHTESAGFCLIATSHRPTPGGERRLISVVLGAASDNLRASESQKLLNWGFVNFDAVKLFDANAAVQTPRVWKGASNTVRLGSPQPLFVTVPRGDAAKVTTAIVRADPLMAPIDKGAKVATLKVSVDNQVIAEQPLVALDAVPRAGFIGRAWDQLRLWLR